MSEITRLPPQAVEVEQAVLGAMLIAADCIPKARALLTEDHFYHGPHAKIFTALCDTYYAEGEVDILSAAEVLKGRRQLEEVGGSLYLSTLAAEQSTAGNLERHAKILREKRLARRGIEVSAEMSSRLFETPDPEILQWGIDTLRAEVERDALAEAPGADASGTITEAQSEYTARRELARQGRRYAGLDCGFEDINIQINGLLPKRLVVVGADSSVGKTTIACQMFHSVISKGGRGGYITIEESLSDIGGRLTCIEANLDGDRYQKGQLSDEEEERAAQAQAKLRTLGWWCYDNCRSLDQIEQQIRYGHRREHVALWVIDHLHEITHRGAPSRHLELKDIVLRLKALAKELSTCILLCSQLARAKDRTDRRPRMDDLRESGSIEEVADVVILLHRPGRYDHIRESVGKNSEALQELMARAQALCEKVRKGRTGTVNLIWRNDVGLFGDKWQGSM